MIADSTKPRWRDPCPNTRTTTPHVPRPLSPRELRVQDTYAFRSPKNGRVVTVVDPARLALALALEFNPEITRYVERPRTLTVAERPVELCFWQEMTTSEERYDLLTNQKESTVHAVRHAERQTALTFEAAASAGVTLRIRKFSHFLSERNANTGRLQLLPYVQASRDLLNGPAVEQAVNQHLSVIPRTSFYAIERALAAFKPCDVRAQVCTMIHRGALCIDLTTHLTLGSMLWRPGTTS